MDQINVPAGGTGPVKLQRPQVPVNAAPRTDALHDLLAQIAALAEVSARICEVSCGRSRSAMSMP
jgi:hypothetical protein